MFEGYELQAYLTEDVPWRLWNFQWFKFHWLMEEMCVSSVCLPWRWLAFAVASSVYWYVLY